MTGDEGNIDELEVRRRLREQQDRTPDETPTPKPQTESARSGRGRRGGGDGPNRPTAVGYGDENHGFRAGQNVACKVIRAEAGGYEVRTTEHKLRGFLPTEANLKEGEEVFAQFVSFSNNRMLLSARLSSNKDPRS